MLRKALVVGIDGYPTAPLTGCVNDANKMIEVLKRNQDGSPNFECRPLLAPSQDITRTILRKKIEELFAQPADVALFYFSGHGTENNLGGFLVTQDAKKYDEGVAMHDILAHANKSPVHEVVIILDCCNSGAFGAIPAINNNNNQAILREGISVLTASRSLESAVEVNGNGIFTTLVYDALNGGAADIMGNVTVASIYAYADQILGAWNQRPLFKSHVSQLLPLRTCHPQVELPILRLLPEYFHTSDYEYPLDPSYEPDNKGLVPKNERHQQIFGHLQKYRAAQLVVPIGEEHMYFAAMNNKSCKLTSLGKFYWSLANMGKI